MVEMMSEKNFAYYNAQTGLIENVIWVDEEIVSSLVWPDGYAVVAAPEGLTGKWSTFDIGWSYVNGEFIEPAEPEQVSIDGTQPTVQGAQTL
jgi:hypothetical protein